MACFVSTFITGFQNVVAQNLTKHLAGAQIISVFDGLIYYRYNANSRDIEKVPYFNNTFFVIDTFNHDNFEKMVNAIENKNHYYLISKGTARVRFCKQNTFCSVQKNLLQKAEKIIQKNSKLSIDRVNPATEIWYATRSEGFSFCGELISKRAFTEKNLNKGELRPEIAYLLCALANVTKDDVVLEPFAGYGAICVQLAKRFNFAHLHISDINADLIAQLAQKKHLQKQNISLRTANVTSIDDLGKQITCIITDPPWGFYEEIDDIKAFYVEMFGVFAKVASQNCKMVILSARVQELEEACNLCNVCITQKINTLVNGKKASAFVCNFC